MINLWQNITCNGYGLGLMLPNTPVNINGKIQSGGPCSRALTVNILGLWMIGRSIIQGRGTYLSTSVHPDDGFLIHWDWILIHETGL